MTNKRQSLKQRTLEWCEKNWIAGWYIAVASTANVLLNLLNLFWD